MSDFLLSPYSLNKTLTLANRVVMAPMTRCMADEHLVPTQAMADYYARRADLGLIITEATIIRPDGQGYPNTPGLFTDEQIEGWKQITAAVHQRGGLIFNQLWHTGRVAHSAFCEQAPVAPSAIAAEGSVPRRRDLTYETPKALSVEAIHQLVDDFVQAALNARTSGFDGVEIHGANGYLLDQFLHYATNQRQDEYGQTPENMIRFTLQVVDGIIAAIGGDRVGIRLSPLGYVNSITPDPRDRQVFDALLRALDQRELAYVHAGLFSDETADESFDGNINDYLRSHTHHPYIGVGGLTPELARQGIEQQRFDLAAIGRPLIANPDYLTRLTHQQELIAYENDMLEQLI